MENRILIIGFGVVGQTLYNNLENQFLADIYDPKLENFGLNVDIDWENINDKYGTIFLCVPTNTGSDVNAEYSPAVINEYMEALVRNKFKGIIIIKSSVLYIDIKKYTEILKIAYWAEFLNDLTAEDDFLKDTCPLIGCENFIKHDVKEILKTNFKHLIDFKFDTIENALNFKFIRNSYIAWKITFWNVIAMHGLMDQRTLKYLMEQYPVLEFMDIATDGKVGFGGKCLPKDFQALTMVANENIFIDILKWNKNLRAPIHVKNTAIPVPGDKIKEDVNSDRYTAIPVQGDKIKEEVNYDKN